MSFRAQLLISVVLVLQGCSPGYVWRAGVEEAKVLWRRQSLEALIAKPDTPPELKRKFQLVLDARQFAANHGLKPGGSYTKYSALDRDIFSWVVVAAPKTELQPVTWWFPFVGRVPYRGYFEKSDAEAFAEVLKGEGNDVLVRPSPAMSTLGWFDDPLLSTVVKFDDAVLVNTVMHEMLHNTIWVKGSAEFNESLANYVGAAAAGEFFASRDAQSELGQVRRNWEGELAFAKVINQTAQELGVLYAMRGELGVVEVLRRRDEVFARAADALSQGAPPGGKQKRSGINNAVIIAFRTYLRELPLFEREYEKCGRRLASFVEAVQACLDRPGSRGKDPFVALTECAETP